MSKKGMKLGVRYPVWIPSNDYQILKEISRERYCSIALLIREGIKILIKKEGRS